MAEYYLDDYAIDSSGYVGSGTVGAVVQGTQYGANSTNKTVDKILCVVFPPAPTMEKKAYVKSDLYAYVTGKRTVITGTLNNGYAYAETIGMSMNWYDLQTIDVSYHEAALSNLVINSYNCIQKRWGYWMGGEAEYRVGLYYGVINGGFYSNVLYTFDFALEISNHLSTHKPYRRVTFADIDTYTTNRFPNKFVDKKVANTFSWEFRTRSSPSTGIPLTQKSAKLRYRNKGVTEYTEIAIDGSQNSYTIPANTFTANNIEWQVIVTSDDDIESTQSDWVAVTTVDSIPSTQIVSPLNEFIDGTKEQTFSWQHVIDTGTAQTKFDMQIKATDTWVDFASEITTNQYYIVVADTLPAGTIQWRVRTYNTDNISGEWSEPAGIVARSSPKPPYNISITATSKPVVRWQAEGQTAFQVIVYSGEKLVYNSGKLRSLEKIHTVTDYLANGSYSVALYIYNSYELASEPTIQTVTIDAFKPLKPTVIAEQVENGVRFTVTNTQDKMQLICNGKLISEFSNATVYDYTNVGTNNYIIRVIDNNDNFEDSDVVTATTIIKGAIIALANSPYNLIFLNFSSDESITKTGQIGYECVDVQYAGRAYPCFEFGESHTQTFQLKYSIYNKLEFEKFKSLIAKNETIIYRDFDGNKIFGIISSFNYTYQPGIYTVDCDIIATNYEVV